MNRKSKGVPVDVLTVDDRRCGDLNQECEWVFRPSPRERKREQSGQIVYLGLGNGHRAAILDGWLLVHVNNLRAMERDPPRLPQLPPLPTGAG